MYPHTVPISILTFVFGGEIGTGDVGGPSRKLPPQEMLRHQSDQVQDCFRDSICLQQWHRGQWTDTITETILNLI